MIRPWLSAAVLLGFAATLPSQDSGGSLISKSSWGGTFLSPKEFLFRRGESTRLPAAYNPNLKIIECSYAASGGQLFSRYFWFQTGRPDWVEDLDANHPLKREVGKIVTRCPESISVAGAQAPGEDYLIPPSGSKSTMGASGRSAVFALPLDILRLRNRWIEERPADGAQPARWLLTDKDLIRSTENGLLVMPLTFEPRRRAVCFNDSLAGRWRCLMTVLHKDELMLAEARTIGTGRFELIAPLHIVSPAPPLPSPEEIAAARMTTVSVFLHNKLEHDMQAEFVSGNGFVARGLVNGQFLLDVNEGAFERTTLQRNSVEFFKVVDQYVQEFATRCRKFLPDNPVQLTRNLCTKEQDRFLVYRSGLRIYNGTACVATATVPWEGMYADPRLFAARQRLDAIAGPRIFSAAMAGSYEALQPSLAVMSDVKRLFDMNSCPDLARFTDNLAAFANGTPPIRLSQRDVLPAAQLQSKVVGGFTGGDGDIPALLEDLIRADSKRWYINRYLNGSVSGVRVAARDSAGRLREVVARYGFNEGVIGSVTLTFENGTPRCLLFFDFPGDCAQPDSAIMRRWTAGEYP